METNLAGLRLRRVTHRGPFDCVFHGPLCGLVVQGAKEVVVGRRRLLLRPGDAMLVSHHLPAVTRIIEASATRPYLAAILPFDLELLAQLATQLDYRADGAHGESAIESLVAGPALCDAFKRLLGLAQTPVESGILAPLVSKEIHLRFLISPQGAVLRTLLSGDSRASRIGRAIAFMRQGGERDCSIASLADIAGLGASSFHAHFKAVTGMTPLGYQKELRLMRARELLLDPQHSVSSVAFSVGYESSTQFSREYSRRFGASPREHRTAPVSTAA
ncbi:AraC family transcriptional regulator [Variovorax sp. KK3]|nr:AraC family transcriptional regulator [Variovorax sp. KK3]